MTDTHEVDLSQHFLSDIEVCWCRVVDGRKRYAIGSLDPLFVVTGKSYSSSGKIASYAEFKQSQHEFEGRVHEQVQQVLDLERQMQE
ncbi:hypothetical protein QVD17_13041 [Tagetes erecta]|nr:hypothetical protein QVD17_13041 [Tagetes erecta]